MKRFFQILFTLLFVAGVVTLAGYIYWKHINSPVKSLIIHISRPSPEKGFIAKQDIAGLVQNKLEVKETKIKEVDYQDLENSLQANPWIYTADVFTDIEGNLIVNVKEKEPVLRIFPETGKGYYLDKEGNVVPLSTHYAPRVPVANGYIKTQILPGHQNIYDTIYKTNDLKELLYLTTSLTKYPFAENLIGELYMNSKGELDMVPLFGSKLIHLGDTSATEQKLENLIAFYKKALLYEGWDKYKTLNLKYKNQIICTKN